jgi:F-type H+-transporting ATPase subunit epsilon
MASFQLELVSPEKLLLSRQVEMATIPAAEGEMGVLPGHAPMIVALRGGTIAVRENGAETERLFVAGGFAEITPERVTCSPSRRRRWPSCPAPRRSAASAEAEAAYAAAAMDTPERRDATMARLLAMRAMRDAAQSA